MVAACRGRANCLLTWTNMNLVVWYSSGFNNRQGRDMEYQGTFWSGLIVWDTFITNDFCSLDPRLTVPWTSWTVSRNQTILEAWRCIHNTDILTHQRSTAPSWQWAHIGDIHIKQFNQQVLRGSIFYSNLLFGPVEFLNWGTCRVIF